MEFNLNAYDLFEELRFIVELVLAELLFALPCYKKRPRFGLRIGIGSAGLLGLSFLYFVWRAWLFNGLFAGNGVAIATWILLHYFLLTLASTFFLFWCFDYHFSQALLNTVGGYAVQHFCFVIFTELLARTWFVGIIDSLPLYIGVSTLGFGLLAGLRYVFFVRKFKTLGTVRVGNESSSVLAFSLLFVLLFALTFSGQSIYQNGARTRVVENPLYLGAFVSLASCSLSTVVLYLIYFKNQKQQEKEIMSALLHEQAKQYALKKREIDTLKRLVHDMKHRLLDAGTDRSDLQKAIGELDSVNLLIDTGNESVNILITAKTLIGMKEGISLEFDGDGGLLSFMEPSDIYVLLGNALDNAIEAILRDHAEPKKILLSIKQTKGVVSLQVVNPFSGVLEMDGQRVKTKKDDVAFHGIGLASIGHIAEKYGGALAIENKDKFFTLRVSFLAR